MFTRRLLIALTALALATPALAPSFAQEKSIVVASTTSTRIPACSATCCRCSRRKPASR